MAGLTLLQGAEKLVKFQNHLEQDTRRAAAAEIGKAWQGIAEREASADLGGDPKFSGWKPLLDTKTKQLGNGTLLVQPTRSSAGPWTVAKFGRNKGNGGGGAFFGPGANRSTGATARTKKGNVRAVRAFKAKRWNGYTTGKGTASRVNVAIEKVAPDIVEKHLAKGLNRFF